MAATKRLIDKLAAQGRAIETPAAIDNTPALELSAIENEGIAITSPITPDTTVELAPAVTAAIAYVASIETALGMLDATSPAYGALQAQLETANGALALAQADAALDAEKLSAIESAHAAATAAKLPDFALAAMLQAIEAKYAPAPAVIETPALDVPAASGRKPIGTVATERNLTVAATLAADSTLAARVDHTINAFRSGDDVQCTCQRVAGTRYASLMPFATNGAGVANAGDYRMLATAIRMRLLDAPYGLKAGGQSVAIVPWLTSTGVHAAGSVKGTDSLRLCFSDRREIALYPDGMFRLATAGTAGVRFLRTDAQALAQFNGSAATPAVTVAPAAPAAPAAQAAPATTPRIPTPPAAQAAPNGTVASTARCQHCSARNFTSNTECSACGAGDWSAN
jgi:hypothetical protein